jgi:hypothetical protein
MAIDVCLLCYEEPSSFLQRISVSCYTVSNAQLIGDWCENRQGALNTVIFLIIRQYYWRTDAPCVNSNGGPNTKKNYWRTVPRQPCLLAKGDIGAPISWAQMVLRFDRHLRAQECPGPPPPPHWPK